MFENLRKWFSTRRKLLGPLPPDTFGADIEDAVNSVLTRDNFPGEDEAKLEERRLKWASVLYRFQRYGHYSIGNRVTVLEGGDTCFPQMLAAIEQAKVRVWCESYIFDGSSVGELFYQALLSAARRGCDVILLADYIGSFALPGKWVEELRKSGAYVVFFNPLLPASASVGPVSFRDHRKIMICDEVGFCGGMNIHEEVGEERFGSSKFYDVHARLEGPCVADLSEVLQDTLRETGGQTRPPMPIPVKRSGGVYVQILQSNVRQRRRTLQEVIEGAIDASSESVFITTAYFFPPGFLRRALQRVPARGVSLSLLLSGSSDFYPLPGDLLAQTHFLGRFLRETRSKEEDVKVHLYSRRHMHAKHMSIDGVFCTIGSFNFDLYSARRNLEVGVSVFDHSVARKLQSLHEDKVNESTRTRLSDYWMYGHPAVRVACAVAYGCIRLSGRNIFDGFNCFQRKWLVRKAALTFQLEEQAASFTAMSMMWGLE
eukprot:TRINITY_DN40249_c0_g1_i1.p1 TRINITY_DN40249_c0_g1~~TRINITY_DN40249_c0_g1_i1.p1  ORF type:complete len:486 (-),score=60.43 TRINITY_DN40249_c0_g1_i1:631-2088(-)